MTFNSDAKEKKILLKYCFFLTFSFYILFSISFQGFINKKIADDSKEVIQFYIKTKHCLIALNKDFSDWSSENLGKIHNSLRYLEHKITLAECKEIIEKSDYLDIEKDH